MEIQSHFSSCSILHGTLNMGHDTQGPSAGPHSREVNRTPETPQMIKTSPVILLMYGKARALCDLSLNLLLTH